MATNSNFEVLQLWDRLDEMLSTGDYDDAKVTAERLIEIGCWGGALRLSNMYKSGDFGQADESEARRYRKLFSDNAVSSKFPVDLRLLAEMYQSGEIAFDEEKANSLLCRAAESGDREAQYEIANQLLRDAKLSEGQHREALRFLVSSALAGYVPAVVDLASQLNSDSVITQIVALEMYRYAAKAGSLRAIEVLEHYQQSQ